jgi:hypothetical protein
MGKKRRRTRQATLLPCVSGSSVVIAVQAHGFANGTTRARGRVGGILRVNIQLAMSSVQTDVQVSADVSGLDSGSGASTTTLNAQAVARLPDDPDDLLRELQILASSSGGDPTATTISVDGFQTSNPLRPNINGTVDALRSQRNRGRISSTALSSSPIAIASSTQPIPSRRPLRWPGGSDMGSN